MADNEASCGPGLAEHAALPAKMAELLEALARNLALHLPSLVMSDEGARAEHEAYTKLADEYSAIADRLAGAAKLMAGYRDLPAAAHDEAKLAEPGLYEAFVRFVAIERELLALLQEAVARDGAMLEGSP